MTTPRMIRSFRRNWRDYGAGIALRKTAGVLFQWVFDARTYRIYRIDLKQYQPQPAREGKLEYRFITADDDAIIAQIETLEDWLEGKVAPKLRAGDICVVALAGDRMAGFNIVGFGRVEIPLIECVRTFRKDYAWSEQISTHPDFRGQGVAAELRYRMFAELKRRGITRFYGGALSFNVGSLKLARKVGFHEIIDVRYRRIFGVRQRHYARLKPC